MTTLRQIAEFTLAVVLVVGFWAIILKGLSDLRASERVDSPPDEPDPWRDLR